MGIPGGLGGVTERVVGAIIIAVITLIIIIAIIFLAQVIAPIFIGIFILALIIGTGILIYVKLKVKEKET